MGWTFRKSLSFGPFRINLSKSGAGYSFGGGGFRTGVRANGRRYSSVNIAGTGITYRTSHGKQTKPGCAILLPVLLSPGLWLLFRSIV